MKLLLATGAACIALSAPATHAESVDEKLERLQKEVQDLKNAKANPSGESSKATLGGYTEIAYNNFRDRRSKDIADLKRFVLFVGYRFNDRTQFFSETEIEHAFVKDNTATAQGELEMEQAYIQHQMFDGVNFRGGLMIIPSGMINEYHEPPVFNGVERPDVDNRIIPTTWRELGLALQGVVGDGIEYNAGIATTPDASQYSSSNGAAQGFRNMRTNGSKSPATDIGYYAAVNWRGMPGLQLGGSVFTGNTAHDGNGVTVKSDLQGEDARLTLWEVHAKYSIVGIDLRALYAAGSLSDTAAINSAAGIAAGSNKAAPESFAGWYVEAAYHARQKGDHDFVPFVRWDHYNTQKEVAAGFTIDPKNDERVATAGFTFKLHPQVVLKADYQNYRVDSTKDKWNVGIGLMF